VTVIAGHRPYEVTTLRKDVATYGRHADVEFTNDWAADARRRDFTMNALYCAADGTIYDPLGGYADTIARQVLFIGDAAERIREDYLRILRFFRFTAHYAEGPADPAGLRAAVRERGGLQLLSGERVWQELTLLLVAKRAVAGITAMFDHGLLTELLGLAPQPTVFARIVEIEAATVRDPDPALRLAALAVEVLEDAARLAARLKVSNATLGVLEDAAATTPDIGPNTLEAECKVLLYREGAERYRRRVLLAWARDLDRASSDPRWGKRLTLPDRWTPPPFPVSGADVVARGTGPGPRVGEILRALETKWIAGNFAPTRDALLAEIPGLAGEPSR